MSDIQKHLKSFNELVALKYQIYNSLFTALPFPDLPVVGAELSVFHELCKKLLKNGKNPQQIIQQFFENIVNGKNDDKKNKILFLFLQFVERQVVLFDALEDAAYHKIHDMYAEGSLKHILKHISNQSQQKDLYQILQHYKAHIVLTAHPTQFYPPQVLSVIQDLSKAISQDRLHIINKLLFQLGKTSFRNTTQPTPLDEAKILMYYLENVFYYVYKNIQHKIYKKIFNTLKKDNRSFPAVVSLGFWPGGDRDGNPNVTPEITEQVGQALKSSILTLYEKELELLKRRLTFPKMWEYLDDIKNRLLATKQVVRSKKGLAAKPYTNSQQLIEDLLKLKNQLNDEDSFIELIDDVIIAVQTFGFHFASIDLRQDSRQHTIVLQKIFKLLLKAKELPKSVKNDCDKYDRLIDTKKITLLSNLLSFKRPKIRKKWLMNDPELYDALVSFQVAQKIQQSNGKLGWHRYIISNTESAYNVLEVLLLAHWAGLPNNENIFDIVPLFETVNDLQNATTIMQQLYELPLYRKHLQGRRNQQYIMLGFSDGTKDGGYLSANWKIFLCKNNIAELTDAYNIEVIFFDGRGGPPARGGENTHKFYRAFENIFPQHQIHLTIQGQTISSKFANIKMANFNVEQLFTAGLQARIFADTKIELKSSDYELLNELSEVSYTSYLDLKNDPMFIPYLEEITPLKHFGELNIASRPPRRKRQGTMRFEDLRAIPFVGAWSQMKQNIPGFYGLGSAMKHIFNQGRDNELSDLYKHSLFFRTLLENAMQSLAKSNFELTAYLRKDKRFGKFWLKLYREAKLTEELLLKVSGQSKLLEEDPISQNSIMMREQLVLPLLIIQQYAMMNLRTKKNLSKKQKKALHDMILKALAANTNASRNSA